MTLDIMETLQSWGDQLKTWTIGATHNPLFWLVLFLLGLAVFKLTYDYLNRKGR